MVEKSDLLDEKIVTCLWETYGIPIKQVTYLPIGADDDAAVYRLETAEKTTYFFKLRSGSFDENSVAFPKFLFDKGIQQIIPPIPTRNGQLWGQLGGYKTVLYPFIEGRNGYEVVLTDAHWAAFGAALKRIHALEIPKEIVGRIRQEKYSAVGRQTVRESLEWIETETFEDAVADEMARLMNAKRVKILDLVDRAEKLAHKLEANPPESIVCHSDLHAGNILIGEDGAFYIVDWDELILAPKERDLMYVGGGLMASRRTPREEKRLFYEAYGQTPIHETAMAYYRYERIVQDIYEYCKLLLKSKVGGRVGEKSVYYLKSNFFPGHTIDIAYHSDRSNVMLEKPNLYGERIFLRPIQSQDAQAMYQAFSDEESNRLTGTHGTFTLEQIQAYCNRISEADDRTDYAIVLKDEPTLVLGEAVLNDISWENRSANFRIALYSSAFFGKGYGTQATRLILKYGFEVLKLHRIELEVFDFNPRAAHVYEKVGFKREGVKRDALLWDGRFQDAIVMSILEDEYAAMK